MSEYGKVSDLWTPKMLADLKVAKQEEYDLLLGKHRDLTDMLMSPGWELFKDMAKLLRAKMESDLMKAEDPQTAFKHLTSIKVLDQLRSWPERECDAINRLLTGR